MGEKEADQKNQTEHFPRLSICMNLAVNIDMVFFVMQRGNGYGDSDSFMNSVAFQR